MVPGGPKKTQPDDLFPERHVGQPVKFTTVTIKEIQADKTHRLDAKYWVKKKKITSKKKQASRDTQAPQLNDIK